MNKIFALRRYIYFYRARSTDGVNRPAEPPVIPTVVSKTGVLSVIHQRRRLTVTLLSLLTPTQLHKKNEIHKNFTTTVQ